MIKKIDTYILKSYFKSFFFAIGLLTVLSVVIDYSQKVDAFVKNKAPGNEIFIYFINFIPHIVALLFPLFIFVSTIFFTSKLAYRSEFIAIQGAGARFARILRPYIIGSFTLACAMVILNNFIVPKASKNAHQFTDKYVYDRATTSDENIHIRLKPNLYVYFQNFNIIQNTGYQFTEEKFEGTLLKQKTFAEQITYNDSTQQWLLKYVTIRKIDGLKETVTKATEQIRSYNLFPDELVVNEIKQEKMTSPELLTKIELEKSRGSQNIAAFEYELHRRTSDAFAGIILTMIAVIIASKKVRGGSGLHLAIGIIFSAFFILFSQFSKTFSLNAGLPPLIAAWIPNIIFGTLAYILYLRRKG